MDAWCQRHLNKPFDKEGAWAAQGRVIQPLLEECLSDPFFALTAPKSIGKEYFSLSWLESHLDAQYSPVDIQATLLALTAHSIANTLKEEREIKQVYLCGGGVHNKHVHQVLSQLLPDSNIRSTASIGINPDYVEAMMFAWLAAQRLNETPVDLRFITGAKSPVVLGAVYPN